MYVVLSLLWIWILRKKCMDKNMDMQFHSRVKQPRPETIKTRLTDRISMTEVKKYYSDYLPPL